MHSAPVTVMGPSAISAAVASSITMRWSPRASAVKPPRRRTGPVTVSVSPSGLTSVFAPSRPSSSCVARSRSHSFRRRRLTPVRVETPARLGAGQCQNGRKIGNVGAVDAGGHQPGVRRAGGVPLAARLTDAQAHLLQHIHDARVALQAVAAQVGQHHAAAHGVHAQKTAACDQSPDTAMLSGAGAQAGERPNTPSSRSVKEIPKRSIRRSVISR